MDESGRIVFSYDPVTRVRTSTFAGCIDDATLLGAFREMLADPGYVLGAHDLVDLRQATAPKLSAAAVAMLVSMFKANDAARVRTRTKTAIVATSDIAFAMARMFQILRGDSPDEIRVFKDYEDARRWLTP
jgi:hypothetical protein